MPSNSNRPPPMVFVKEDNASASSNEDTAPLSPPQPKFTLNGPEISTEYRSHSRATSNGTLSPPMSARSLTFNVPPSNPFATPGIDSPMETPAAGPDQYFPVDAHHRLSNSVATSMTDLPRIPTNTSSLYSASRPGTSDYSMSATSSVRASRYREAFNPPPSRPMTIYASPSNAKLVKERAKSTMLEPGASLHKPWLNVKDRANTVAYFLTYGVMLLGIGVGALRIYLDWVNVPMMKGNLCPVLDENFENGDESVFGENGAFFREVDMSGYGNGEFQMTTGSPNNSFISNGKLYLRPTLTSESVPMDAILDGHVYNITGCTFNITRGGSYTQVNPTSPSFNTSAIGQDNFDAEGYYRACSAVSNSTAGRVINPVQSARLTTRRAASIRYGKVEVKARLPTGDWLWPAIWMLPVDHNYGPWPLSGEIDIMEARGNGPKYRKEGTNYVRGSLNWGPTTFLNAAYKTYGLWKLRRGTYDQDFHTYTLEWTEDFIRISVDSKLHKVLLTQIKKSFWESGDFPSVVRNGTGDIVLTNPWKDGSKAAPFDQRFYLILSLGVGSTNGWFPDGSDKPWLDGSQTAARDFLSAKDRWLPTWPEDVDQRSFVIDSVKMWQQC